MCRSTAKGGRRCASSHPAVRAARRASARLAQSVAGADAGHPARAAYEQTQVWAARTREAAEAGDDEKAKLYAEQAKQSAAATRGLMTGAPPPSASPPVDPRLAFALGPRPDDPPAGDGWGVPQSPEYPEHVRAAAAFAQASGVGGNATFLPRQDGGQTVAWSDDRFAGAATVYPGSDGEPPYARVVVTRLDQDGYQALADSPWPYRVEHGHVVYDRVPADHAEQIVTAARTGQAGRPWERHGFSSAGYRDELDDQRADALVPESAAWAASLNAAQQHWTATYTGHKYRQINAHLYTGRDLDQPAEGMSVPMREVSGNINSAIRAAGVAETPHHTYRGFTPPLEARKANRVAEWARANFPAGTDYQDKSFMSSSHCPNVAANPYFARTEWDDGDEYGEADHAVVFELVSRKGAAVAQLSNYGNDERERLHESGSKWVSVGVQENVRIDGRDCVVIRLVDRDELRRF
ncbi:hypothetical protein [Streptomyces sp. NBC_01304]|uniref:hypothetical protein n=1 Tax=Streptomyces sp. NBC_01304 TaxID=2903818 RepID=UPI002E0F9813|nr:hypothetical protein OG430_48540 [Streptomyces sp. NBC_01304]